MKIKLVYQRIEQPLEFFGKLISYVGTITILIGWASQFFSWGNTGPFIFVRDNLLTFWLWIVTISILTIWIWLNRLNSRFITRFKDSFNGDPRANWDFEGPWRIAEPNTLLVTGSDAGGLTKVGATWENYTFTFDARITHQCIGVVIRAQDLNNYYMLQINRDNIRSHRRVAVPIVDEPIGKKASKDDDKILGFNVVKFAIGWQVFDPPIPVNPALDGWFKVRVVVRGESIRLYINNDLHFQQESFLKIPTGKVGFRNDGAESALVRNVKVIIEP